ncbi:MAG: EthD family reductase [Gammaproteobacteria bacterium]|nr:EthD family reductase [Gammaproteobacteria bacterium]
MIKVSVMYPRKDGATFDMDYYCATHMPLVREKLGAALKGMSIDSGLAGPEPGSAPAYVAMGHLLFDSTESFQAAFAPHAEAILGDIRNYTDIEPIIQISDVKL